VRRTARAAWTAFAVAQLGDLVRAFGLPDGARRRVPCRSGRKELLARALAIQARHLVGEPQLLAGLLDTGPRDPFVGASAPAGEDRNGERGPTVQLSRYSSNAGAPE